MNEVLQKKTTYLCLKQVSQAVERVAEEALQELWE